MLEASQSVRVFERRAERIVEEGTCEDLRRIDETRPRTIHVGVTIDRVDATGAIRA